MAKIRNRAPLVKCWWEPREFVQVSGKVQLPFPIVAIESETVRAIEEQSGVALSTAAHSLLEKLVARRIFNVCGFTDLGANLCIVPMVARPLALKVADAAASLLAAMTLFDASVKMFGSNHLEESVAASHGVDPKTVIKGVADVYRCKVPSADYERELGLAVFMSEVRDQLLSREVTEWSELGNRKRKALLVSFLAALNESVLTQCKVHPPDNGDNRRRRQKSKSISIALVKSSGDPREGLRLAIKRHLRPYDEECAEMQAHWAQVFERVDKAQKPDPTELPW